MNKNIFLIPASVSDSAIRSISVSAITGYQKYLSPHKGFACAHRVLYGSESCSQYIKQVIAKEGLKTALVKSRLRFQSCKQAHLILRSQAEETEESQQEKKQQPTIPKSSCQDSLVADLGTACAQISCEGCVSSSCSGLDFGVLDCGVLDCGILDCASCGW
ncbi:membrane protein insertion efficiency factor YidD [Okeanomitos corallinicola TIOX110]|uniref:Membrane protein insertion efficiency factor YidD n=1 Tax=Okeanomitos corallinicola TIOX110 TaxID=3133117 RepID=A0ABZ2ULI2_9CYAN